MKLSYKQRSIIQTYLYYASINIMSYEIALQAAAYEASCTIGEINDFLTKETLE